MLGTIFPTTRGTPTLCICSPVVPAVLLWFASATLSFCTQEIHITVLNGRNGKPIANECLNVWTGTEHGAHLVAVTNKDGVAALRLTDGGIHAETACPGWPSETSRHPGADGIMVNGDRYVGCQEYGKITSGEPPTNPVTTLPSYPIKKILESGVNASNTCGKFRGEPKPGELIFYVRPRSFFEKMKQ